MRSDNYDLRNTSDSPRYVPRSRCIPLASANSSGTTPARPFSLVTASLYTANSSQGDASLTDNDDLAGQ